MYVSEHRKSFDIDYEMSDVVNRYPHITLFPISAARLNAVKAAEILSDEGIVCDIVHLLWLKPFIITDRILDSLNNSGLGGVVIDTDYENGAAKCIASDLTQHTDKKVRVLGLEERTAGFAAHLDNLPPSVEKICEYVRKVVNRR